MTTAIGLLAAAMTTLAWVPQLLRTRRLRSAAELSWLYLATMTAGLSTWLAYGLIRHDVAIISANVVSLTLVVSLGAYKARDELTLRRLTRPRPADRSGTTLAGNENGPPIRSDRDGPGHRRAGRSQGR
ncbi:MAG TPA: PQ-loop domain-containing transporter [Mycobacteriales bacterium]|nr:PQ-loop domain-containing transporter [Mycobacteriales bacterium]